MVNTNKMAEGGFEVVNKDNAPKPKTREGGPRPQTGRGGRGRGGDRGPRPRPQLDADGNPIKRKEREPFRGNPDRKPGFGSTRGGRQGDRKGGHGKFGTGDKQDVAFKQKGEAGVTETPEGKTEATVEEEKKEEVEVITETIGISMEEFLANKMGGGKKEARQAEGIKGAKVQALDTTKSKQSTVLQNQYLKGAVAKTADANNVLFGFGAVKDDDDVPSRGGRGRGGRGGKEQRGGARRQNPKQALKKTDEEFPTL